MQETQVYKNVQDRYCAAAQSHDHGYGSFVAKQFGYSEDELSDIPKDSNLGLSCGNPHALANLKDACYLLLRKVLMSTDWFEY